MNITYPESHESGEEFNTSCLDNRVTTGDTRQVNESRLDNAGLALEGLDDTLGESTISQHCSLLSAVLRIRPVTGESHRESCGASAIFGLDNLITTELDTFSPCQ